MLHDPHGAPGSTRLRSLLSSGVHRSRRLDPFHMHHFNPATDYFANHSRSSTTPRTSQRHRADRDRQRRLFHRPSMTQQQRLSESEKARTQIDRARHFSRF
jgi:hypothetical protein